MTDDQKEDLVIKNAIAMTEYFDSVVILATSANGKTTDAYWHSAGNHYANEGVCRDFLRISEGQQVEEEDE